jgi:hypothetical protein
MARQLPRLRRVLGTLIDDTTSETFRSEGVLGGGTFYGECRQTNVSETVHILSRQSASPLENEIIPSVLVFHVAASLLNSMSITSAVACV